MRFVVKTLPVWLMIIPLATLNGMARDCLMQPLLGVFALPVSGLTLCVLVLTLTWLFVPRLGIKDLRQLALVGLVGLAAGSASGAAAAGASAVVSGQLTGCAKLA